MARLSDERMCRGSEFQLLGEDTEKAREAKEMPMSIVTVCWCLKCMLHLPCAQMHYQFDILLPPVYAKIINCQPMTSLSGTLNPTHSLIIHSFTHSLTLPTVFHMISV